MTRYRMQEATTMADKKSESKKPASKVTVTKKTVNDLKLKPGKADAVKGGIIGYPNLIVRR